MYTHTDTSTHIHIHTQTHKHTHTHTHTRTHTHTHTHTRARARARTDTRFYTKPFFLSLTLPLSLKISTASGLQTCVTFLIDTIKGTYNSVQSLDDDRLHVLTLERISMHLPATTCYLTSAVAHRAVMTANEPTLAGCV